MNSNWAHVLSECLTSMEREQVGSSCSVVDHEIVPSLSGGPEDVTVWLIFRNGDERRLFVDTERSRTVSALRKKLLAAGYPEGGVASLAVRVTSRGEFSARGGGFVA